MVVKHPIFGELDGGEGEETRRREHAQKLKALLEAKWNSRVITNAKRTARYTKPVGMGGKKGYDNDIFGE